MNLTHHYYNDTVDKFVINIAREGDRPSLTMNTTKISSQEFDAIEAWCRARNRCRYYTIGIVVFDNPAAMTEFLLKWS
jgi:hypothetical protein